MIPCENHPARVASVVLDWDDDTLTICADCVVPELGRLTETLRDMFLGEPVIRIRMTGPNPHPVDPADDTIICAGCGHLLASMDDTIATDAPGDPTGLTVWHVDCPMPAGLTMTPDGPVWA